MHFTTPLILLAATSATVFGYVVEVFDFPGCEGDSYEINVYDNTCHTTGGQYYNSFIVKAYGAHRQRAGFYAYGGGCDALSGSVQDWWADGGSNVFIKGHCVDVPFAYSSLGSRSA